MFFVVSSPLKFTREGSHKTPNLAQTRIESKNMQTLVHVSYRAYKVGEHIPLCKRTMLVLCVTPTPRSVGSVSPKFISPDMNFIARKGNIICTSKYHFCIAKISLCACTQSDPARNASTREESHKTQNLAQTRIKISPQSKKTRLRQKKLKKNKKTL